MRNRSKNIGGVIVIVCFVLAIVVAASSAQAITLPILTRPVLKSFFQSGDKPTQQQFGSLIDSTVNFVDDRYLLGLKVYDPQLIYVVGDTVIFNRLAIDDIIGGSSGGLEFAPAVELTGPDAPTLDMATHFAGQYGFLGIQLQDSLGTYNGYLQLSMDAPSGLPDDPPAIHVEYVVYNDVPGEPITIVAVPEPTAAMLLVALPLLRRWRR